MNAAELRALAKTLRHETPTTPVFNQAAEILELIAWAEEESNEVEIYQSPGKPRVIVGIRGGKAKLGPTLIGTLRRAREASKS